MPPECHNPFNPQFPAPEKFFSGRERQLKQLSELLDALDRGIPANLSVIGRGGEGKTTYLLKIVEEAKKRFVTSSPPCVLGLAKSAEDNIDTIVRSILRAIEEVTGQRKLEDDWKQGASSSFRTPRREALDIEELRIDFERILTLIPNERSKNCVICVDEAHRIHPIALSALKNSLQQLGRGYMIVLSLLNDKDSESNDVAGNRILEDLATRSNDPGAARFFKYNFTSLGPFDKQEEAEVCIKKRLTDNVLAFSPSVIRRIPNIVGRHPSGIIALSKVVYQLAQESGKTEADEQTLLNAFTSGYQTDVDEALRFCMQLSKTDKKIYAAALTFDTRFTAKHVAEKIGGTPDDPALTDLLAQTVRGVMNRIVDAGFCEKAGEEEFYFQEPERTHALRLALGG